MSKRRNATPKKKHGCLRAIGTLLLLVIILVAVVGGLMLSTYIRRSYRVDWSSEIVTANAYIVNPCNDKEDKPPFETMISAHRAGRTLAPENTLAAFEKCFDNREEKGYSFDVLEFDLHLTKDDQLVLLHDDTLDRTSNCVEKGDAGLKPGDKNLVDLYEYNMAYNFEDPENPGTYPYREEEPTDPVEKGRWLFATRICTIDQVFALVKNRLAEGETMHYIIEIKDSGADGQKAVDLLYSKMINAGVLQNTIVGTFHQEVTDYIDQLNNNTTDPTKKIVRSASIKEVLLFYFSCVFNLNLSKQDLGYSVLQIPYKDYVINLGKPGIIEYAHAFGIAVQYWTINDPKDMEYLAAIGADCIMTDDPATLYETIK